MSPRLGRDADRLLPTSTLVFSGPGNYRTLVWGSNAITAGRDGISWGSKGSPPRTWDTAPGRISGPLLYIKIYFGNTLTSPRNSGLLEVHYSLPFAGERTPFSMRRTSITGIKAGKWSSLFTDPGCRDPPRLFAGMQGPAPTFRRDAGRLFAVSP